MVGSAVMEVVRAILSNLLGKTVLGAKQETVLGARKRSARLERETASRDRNDGEWRAGVGRGARTV